MVELLGVEVRGVGGFSLARLGAGRLELLCLCKKREGLGGNWMSGVPAAGSGLRSHFSISRVLCVAHEKKIERLLSATSSDELCLRASHSPL